MKVLLFIVFICVSHASIGQQARLVMDITPGSSSTFDVGENIRYGFDDKVIFTKASGDKDKEFWVSDGTEIGTTKLFDYFSNQKVSQFNDAVEDELVFIFEDNGVHFLASLNHLTLDTSVYISSSEGINELTWYDGAYFYNIDGDLWKYDPLSNENEMIYDFEGYFGLKRIGVLNSQLIMIAGTPDGDHLFTSDGTTLGTSLYYFLYKGSSIPNDEPYFTQAGDLLYFFYYKPDDSKYSLFCTDGTEVGTKELIDLERINVSTNLNAKREIIAWNDKLLFRAAPESSFAELFVSDGTIAGTFIIDTDNNPDNEGKPSYFTPYNGELFFSGSYGSPWVTKIYSTDGTQDGTKVVDMNSVSSDGASGLAFFNDSLCFSAYKSFMGDELCFATNMGNSERFLDILPGDANVIPQSITATDKYLFFTAETSEHGRELWIYDPDTTIVWQREVSILPLRISPNPCQDVLYIDGDFKPSSEISINYYSSDGRLVLSKPFEYRNNIEAFAPGLYKVVVQTQNGIFANWVNKQ